MNVEGVVSCLVRMLVRGSEEEEELVTSLLPFSHVNDREAVSMSRGTGRVAVQVRVRVL